MWCVFLVIKFWGGYFDSYKIESRVYTSRYDSQKTTLKVLKDDLMFEAQTVKIGDLQMAISGL